ncbi:Zn-ribbon domain-containing OB-fold protein [Streptacidiphilus fuscans]|uniref:DUF35 domain-containing protein n=1 Tax=Streptacidiphilus fuscans TaxID=2789292 RepID=A0A931B4S2_9ACTN|nr:hypothetical protein [Streptacidiphilus fuscans]MBF9068971.1 hypothetical protein [Streptacidiphilus fuscans]MBF9073425.1 hypothetical protein [Streptacidiphilus fuscans]
MPATLTLPSLAPLADLPCDEPELRYHRCPWCGSATGRAALLCPICGCPELVERVSAGTGTVHRVLTPRHRQFGFYETHCLVVMDEGFTVQASLDDALPGTVPEGTRVRLADPADQGHLPIFRACA